MAIIYRHVHEEPIGLRTLAPQVPDIIAEVVMRAIATDAEDRYPSAEAFGLALAAAATEAWGRRWLYPTGRILLAEGPILAMLQDAASGAPLPRRKVPAAPPAASTVQAPPRPPTTTTPAVAARRSRRPALVAGAIAVVAAAIVAVAVATRHGGSSGGGSSGGPPAGAAQGASAGNAFVRIDRITTQAGEYVVFYSAQNFVPRLEAGNRHVHFFWNTVAPANAGANGHPPGAYAVYAGPVPFRGFRVAERPAGASQICALVADDSNSVDPGSGNCAPLPG
jgi:hypothetical protein